MPGVIIPRSRQGDSVAPVVGLPQLQAENPGLEPAVRGLAQGTAAITDIGEKIRRQEDEARVTDALTLAERRWQTALYSTDGGLLQRRGVNALEGDGRKSVIDDGLELRRTILDETMATLGTPRQQTALKSAWAARERFAVDSLQRHMEREREAYRDSADEAYIATQQEALTLAEDDVARSVALAQIAGKAQEIADRKGLAPEAADVMIRELTSPALESAIANMARTDPDAARKLFDDRRDFIKADRFEAIETRLEVEGVTVRSQELVDSVFARMPGASLVAIEDAIRAESSGKLEDDALSRARSRWSVNEQARSWGQARAAERLSRGIYEFFQKPPSERPAELVLQNRDQLVRSGLDAGLDGASISALLSTYDTLSQGRKVATNWTLYDRLMKDPGAIDREGWNAATLQNQLASTQLGQVLDQHRDWTSGSLLADDGLTAEITTKLDAAKIDDDAAEGGIRSAILEELRAKEGAGAITAQERSAIIQKHISSYLKSDAGLFTIRKSVKPPAEREVEIGKQSPDMLALAHWRASNGGAFRASPDAVMGQIALIEQKITDARAAGGEDAVKAQLEAFRAQGRRARIELGRQGYEAASLFAAETAIAELEAYEREQAIEKQREEARQKQADEVAARNRAFWEQANRPGITVPGAVPDRGGR